MKKRAVGLILMAGLIFSLKIPVQAETFYGGDRWRVIFEDNDMRSTFSTREINDSVSGLQPGDNVIMNVKLENEDHAATDWYMSNKVLYSLEDRSSNENTKGGAYAYKLVYVDHEGTETVLYDSDVVGGERITSAGEGLHAATSALQDYFYLDTLTYGEKGHITLEVALDGETEGNDYQDTLADLQMNFAVEVQPVPEREIPEQLISEVLRTRVVRTGDENQPVLFFVLMMGSGAALLAFAIYQWKGYQKRRKGEV